MAEIIRLSAWLAASWALSFLFVCVAVYDVKRSSPAQFYPWIKIKPEQLVSVSAYNQENCSMWMSCAFIFFVNGVIGLFARKLSAVLLLLFLFPGSMLLVQRYHRILSKYSVLSKGDAARS